MNTTLAPPETKLITGEEFWRMGNLGPSELIEGRIVMGEATGDAHGVFESGLGAALTQFVRQRKLGWVMVGEVGIYTRRNPDWVRGADIIFVSRQRLPDGPTGKFLEVAPELIVEIMSPNDRWQEVRDKLEEYFALGVARVWIVEPSNRAVLVYDTATHAQRLNESDMLKGEGILAEFAMPVVDIFEW
jgi:Uma2 family endonuclease